MQQQVPFPEPTRQSSAAILFILGNVLRMLVRQLWVLILVVFFNPKKQVFGGFTWLFIGMALLGALISVISYFNFYFYIKDGELVLEKGVLRKTKINVPLDRIQTINFKQGILHQTLNVVAVEIDTAGSAGQEFSLQAIRKEQAEALRSYVEANNSKATVLETGDDEGHAAPKATTEGLLLFRLKPADLLKIGLSQNHLRTAGIIMAFTYGFIDDVANALDIQLEKELEKVPGMATDDHYAFLFLWGVVFFLVLSVLLSLLNTVLRYFDLRVFKTLNGLKMVSGLFTRHEVSASFPKIQFMRWSDNPLRRYFKMVHLRLPQAASVAMGRKTTFSVPGCYQDQLATVQKICFPDEEGRKYTPHGIHRRIIWRQVWLQAIGPVAVLLYLTWGMPGHWLWLLWLPIGMWLAVRFHKNWQWQISEEALRAEWGVVTRRGVLLELFKVQGVTLHENWFLRRRNLAHIELHTAAGSVRIPYLPKEKATRLCDWVLYKVESSSREWM
ncbi:MAG: hypothetical protein CMN32_17390 [Saprospirales bacterium]|nr:hypothetical protein [Saprospirales bacterium]